MLSSLQLLTSGPMLNISLPSSIHPRKTINLFAASCNTNSCRLRFAAANKKRHISFVHGCRRTTCNYSKISDEEDEASVIKKADDDARTAFLDVYSVLKSEFLDDPKWTPDSLLWLQQMMDYNVPRGNLMRGLSVIDCYKFLKQGKEPSEDEIFDASVVGWCIQWIRAGGDMLDDIMDNSETRYGQTCWYRVPGVGNIAINDAALLMSYAPTVLKSHFRHKPCYVDLLDLFNEVSFQTFYGQMLDIITTTGEERNLSNHTLHRHHHIARYKSCYYTFYLPVACALLIAGENLEEHANMKDVLLEMGLHFRIVDDYLDCFGDPDKTGKIGTDIEDFKCSWLVAKALELGNDGQRQILNEHYGKANPSDVAKVKGVYNELNLQGVFAAYERESYEKLRCWVKAHPIKVVQAIWDRYSKGIPNY